ncbi:MAG: nucleotidyltransferase [Ignavibacteria bacterium]|nr:nucleotidyltransferase [Ignavibacteria bacterium]
MKPTLLVLAAGLGSRFGELKQLEGIGPNGEIIMDYSISDALKAGFGKVVLIVQEQMIPILTERYIVNQKLPVEFVVQKKELTIDNVFYVNQKPWGTAHALWCAKESINENFLLINADDFYGQNSYALAFAHLSQSQNPCAILYPILKTLSENGTVNRAEVQIENGLLIDSIEREKLILENDVILYPNKEGQMIAVKKDTFVSMNMWGFTTAIFDYLDKDISNFITKWQANNGIEYQLPSIVASMIKEKIYTVEVIITDEEWIGITYQSDKELAKVKLQKLHNKGIYNNLVWKN